MLAAGCASGGLLLAVGDFFERVFRFLILGFWGSFWGPGDGAGAASAAGPGLSTQLLLAARWGWGWGWAFGVSSHTFSENSDVALLFGLNSGLQSRAPPQLQSELN